MDEYEPGATNAELDIIFDEVAEFLPNLLSEVIEYQNAQEPIVSLNGPFAVETQRQIGLSVMKALGFDFNHGRLDVSHHPFCGGNPTDIRITTRYAVDDFTQSLMGVIHETGHALYEGVFRVNGSDNLLVNREAWGFTKANLSSWKCRPVEVMSSSAISLPGSRMLSAVQARPGQLKTYAGSTLEYSGASFELMPTKSATPSMLFSVIVWSARSFQGLAPG